MTPEEILGKKSSAAGVLTDKDKPNSPGKPIDPTYEQYETPLPRGLTKINTFIKQIKTSQPRIYSRFFPKIYTNTAGFADWRIPASVAAAGVMTGAQNKEYTESYQACINLVAWALEWEVYKCPLFFVKPDFLKAMQETSIPNNFDLSDLKLPYTSMTFVLPQNSTVKLKGRSVQYIGISRRKGAFHSDMGELRTKTPGLDKIIITTAFYPTTFFACGFKFDDLNDIVRMPLEEFTKQSLVNPDDVSSVNETRFMLSLLKLSLNMVLAMESRPQLLETGSNIGHATVAKGRVSSQIWTPNLLGARYKLVRTDEHNGTHASPRSHWRRGHFRRQNIAKKLCQVCKHPRSVHEDDVCMIDGCEPHIFVPMIEYKTVWIDPVLVNAFAN